MNPPRGVMSDGKYICMNMTHCDAPYNKQDERAVLVNKHNK